MKKYLALMLGGLYVLGGCGGGPAAPPPPPSLSLAPASLTFGVSVVGIESGPQVETLTNTGGSELAINSVAIIGTNAADFDQSSTCGSSLAAGASCTLSVSFTPSQLGLRSASITITDDGIGSPQLLPLRGAGGDSGPNATLSPTNLSLGNEVIGTTSPAQAITLSNYGTSTLSVTSITASSSFGETNTCSSTLASGASCTINLTFTPSASGNVSGTLSVTDSAPGSPQTVVLTGTGATTKDTLTGYCWGGVHRGAPNQCGTGQNLIECPVGVPAINPATVGGCFPPQSELVDTSRTCEFRTHSGQSGTGYCVAQY